MLEGGMAVLKKTVDEDEAFQSHNPVSGFAETPGDGRDAGIDIAAGVGGHAQDLSEVFLVGWLVVVAGSFDNGDVELWSHGAGDFGNTDACLILYCSNHLPDRGRCHCLNSVVLPPFSLWI